MEATPLIPDFELIRQIGRGSYGDVWLGRSVTGVYRAIKVVNRARFEDSRPFLREFDGIKRFQRAVGSQARQLALLHVGCDEEAGVLYYIMELADDAEAGTDINPSTYVPLTLKELRLRRAHSLPVAECLVIGAELALALLELHEAGLIHRDVKPSNIIFVSGAAKLADVGLIASSEQTLTSLGTPGYAPTIGAGTAPADLYALGKILYELATGLDADEFPRLPLAQVSSGDTKPLLELNEIILRACDPDPALRYPSAQTMIDDIRLLQAGRSLQESNRNRQRLRWLIRVTMVGALLGAVALAVLGIKNYSSLRKLAATETAARQQAETNEQVARYISDLNLARLGLAAGDFGAARRALRRQLRREGVPDLRGFEWYALWNETVGDAVAMGGALGGPVVRKLTVSPDSNQMAAQEGERPRDTVVWDLATGTRRVVARDTYGLGAFTADGQGLMIGTVEKNVFRFSLQPELRGTDEPVSGRLLHALADGHTLLLSEQRPYGSRLFIWDAEGHVQLAEWIPERRPYRLTLSAATLSSAHALLAASFVGADGLSRHRELIVHDLRAHADRFHLIDVESVQAMNFSPDDRHLAIALRSGLVRVVSAETGETLHRLAGSGGPVRAVEYSADGRWLASAGADRTLRVWDAESGVLRFTFRGHEGEIASLAWLADNQRIVTGSQDGTWRIWSLARPPVAKKVVHLWNDILGDFLFSPDGKFVAVTDDDGQLALLDSSTLERVQTIAGIFQPLLFENEGRTLLGLSKENALKRWEVEGRTLTDLGLKLSSEQKLASVETSSRHRQAAFGFDQGAIEVWDLAHLKSSGPSTLLTDNVGALAWAPEQLELSAGDLTGKIRRADLRVKGGGEPTWAPQNSGVYSLAYSNDGEQLAIGRADGAVVIESRRTGEVLARLEGHSAASVLAFSPDGSRLVTGGSDGLIIFWSLVSRRQIAVWSWDDRVGAQPTPGIFRLRFDVSGRKLGALTSDGQLRVWDASP